MYSFCLYLIVLDGVAGRRSGWLRFLSAIPSALALPPLFVRFITRNPWPPSHTKLFVSCPMKHPNRYYMFVLYAIDIG